MKKKNEELLLFIAFLYRSIHPYIRRMKNKKTKQQESPKNFLYYEKEVWRTYTPI